MAAPINASPPSSQGLQDLREQLQQARASIAEYDLEKREILLGSEAVGPAGQVLVVDGARGAIVGTKVCERTLQQLAPACNTSAPAKGAPTAPPAETPAP